MTDQEMQADIQRQIDSGELSGVRAKILAPELRLIGTEPTDTIYIANVFPFDNFEDAKVFSPRLSGCGLVTETGWRGPYDGDVRKVGLVDDDRLYMPYAERNKRGGTYQAVSLEYDIAIKHKALVSAEPWVEGTPMPSVGDAVIMGNNTAAYARGKYLYQHEATVAYWRKDTPGVATSIDGGQPGVALRTRAFVEVWTGKRGTARSGELWCGDLQPDGECPLDASGRPLKGRRVVCYVNVDKLRLRLLLGLEIPEIVGLQPVRVERDDSLAARVVVGQVGTHRDGDRARLYVGVVGRPRRVEQTRPLVVAPKPRSLARECPRARAFLPPLGRGKTALVERDDPQAGDGRQASAEGDAQRGTGHRVRRGQRALVRGRGTRASSCIAP
jgi:hypothetical protein